MLSSTLKKKVPTSGTLGVQLIMCGTGALYQLLLMITITDFYGNSLVLNPFSHDKVLYSLRCYSVYMEAHLVCLCLVKKNIEVCSSLFTSSFAVNFWYKKSLQHSLGDSWCQNYLCILNFNEGLLVFGSNNRIFLILLI